MTSSVPLTIDDIHSTLATMKFGHRLFLHRELDSTNREAMALAQDGTEHGAVIVAESQTAGRGRLTRRWFSPPGVNLYCSVIIRPINVQIPLTEWLSWIPLSTALALCESVQSISGLFPSLKWPNDLLIDGRKIGGILCESGTDHDGQSFVVIGIGLNVNISLDAFPPELQDIAGSLVHNTHRPIDRNRLLAQLLLDLEQALDELASKGPHRLTLAYAARCTTIGRQVRVLLSTDREVVGVAQAVGLDGALHILPSAASSSPLARQVIEVRAADVLHLGE